MDKVAYRKEADRKRLELAQIEPTSRCDRAILDLKCMDLEIMPGSDKWRWGYKKSIRMAIKALESQEIEETIEDRITFVKIDCSKPEMIYNVKGLLCQADEVNKITVVKDRDNKNPEYDKLTMTVKYQVDRKEERLR